MIGVVGIRIGRVGRGLRQEEANMSVFRVVYRQNHPGHRPPEEFEAVEFIRRDPWIIFLDPAGTCATVRSEDVQRIERITLALPDTEPTLPPPSDPVLPVS
jgi:hypothetical protein